MTYEQERIKMRTQRLALEEKRLREKVSEQGLIMAVDRHHDTLTIQVRRLRTNDIVELDLYEFPNDYPWQPPKWIINSQEVDLPDINRSKYDPFQGQYGPSWSLYLICERIVDMTYKTDYYKKKKY